MNKRLLAGMIAVMTLSGISAAVADNGDVEVNGTRDTRIIVEVNQSLDNLSAEEIRASQDNAVRAIKSKVTTNLKVVNRYSVLNNAFVAEVNSSDIEAIRALKEVASVTVDKIHMKKDLSSDQKTYTAKFTRPAPVVGEDTGDEVTNISAVTMNKPAGTNDGEGTVIAILDNEFNFRGEHTPNAEALDDGTPWNHAVYKPLANGIVTKFTYDSVTPLFTNKKLHAKRAENTAQGKEGSCYFNNKVPFYYDYGGETTSYGKVGEEDFDVSSNLAYHGSHVASIASANANTYKGIAPKAQLACMKVFTNYEADKLGEQMGFGSSSGAYDSAILNAVEDAIVLGVDGINMSLGSDLDDFDADSVTMKTLKRLADDEGIMSAISAGNAGKSSYSFTGGYGNWTTDMVETGILGSYANSTLNTIIASGQPTKIYFENGIKLLDKDGNPLKSVAYDDQIVNREGLDEQYTEDQIHKLFDDLMKNVPASEQATHKIPWQYIPGFGTAEDYGTMDVTGKVVAVNRGSTSFAEKYKTASDKGASAIIIINNDPTATDFNFRCDFGEDFSPTIPCVLALYKDKPTFETIDSGYFVFINKEEADNDLQRTISSFSTDGARFDYSLKPDITAPGENIRGAVPPQKREHREETPYSTYEYLSGTSMSAPNYAGAQSLVLSKVAKEVYSEEKPSAADKDRVKKFRKTVDLRLMSTANPMFDANVNPEDPTKGVDGAEAGFSYTSPRMQGAGMVDLGKAYNTDIYLDGLDENGARINKSKIQLKNNADIKVGTLNLKFAAVNEGAAKTYTAKTTVMRPAIAKSNKVLSAEYNYRGEYSELEQIPGLTYACDNIFTETVELKTNRPGNFKKNDVIKITKNLEYFTELQDESITTVKDYVGQPKVFEQAYYYNAANTGCDWKILPDYDYQSIQDVVLTTYYDEIQIPEGESIVTIPEHKLSEAMKADILSKYEYGCALEGYVELLQEDERKLSIPFLGFFSGDEKSLRDAPVVEPFKFEKDKSVIYPSDLVNDVTKQLVGKEKVNFSSLWVAGYAETPVDVNLDNVLMNNASLLELPGFSEVGINPATGKYFENPKDNIYVGNPEKTNTMIINQFVLRSVKDNYFTITNKETGEIVYKSVLKDLMFGEKQLYKSHVDANYLGAGYVAHRASAIIPLYNMDTREAFADGNYEITFKYQLAYDESWVSNTYNFVLDSKAPEITNITEYTSGSTQRIRIDIAEQKVVECVIGYDTVDCKYDSVKKCYYVDETKEFIDNIIDEMSENAPSVSGQKRLFISITDPSYATTTAVIHFFGNTHSNWVMAQGSEFRYNTDFTKDGTDVEFYSIDDGDETPFELTSYAFIKTSFGEEFEVELPEEPKTETSKGCGGSLVAGTILVSVSALAGAGLISLKKRKDEKEEN